MKPATAGAPYTVPPEPSRLPAFLLAVAVHALLLGFLWFGISWQNTEPVAVQAEVWDMSVQSAAAPELPPPPAPEPAPQPEPEPAPPPPRVVEPPPVERPAPTPPDINLQREKERKEQQKRELAEKEREQKHKEELRKEEQRKQELAEKKKKEREETERAEKKELAKKEAEDKKKAEKLAAEKAAKDKAAKEKAEAAKLEKMRQDEIKRMAGAMGTSGSAEKSTGPRSDDGYVAALTAAIKSATSYGGSTTMPGNPRAVFKVEQLPTGEVMSVRLVKSSGVPEFDRAVENGIRKASPLPKRKDGTVARTADIGFSMKDYD